MSEVRASYAAAKVFFMPNLLVTNKSLTHVNDRRFVAELTRFKLEANHTPLTLDGRCFRRIEPAINYPLQGLSRGD